MKFTGLNIRYLEEEENLLKNFTGTIELLLKDDGTVEISNEDEYDSEDYGIMLSEWHWEKYDMDYGLYYELYLLGTGNEEVRIHVTDKALMAELAKALEKFHGEPSGRGIVLEPSAVNEL